MPTLLTNSLIRILVVLVAIGTGWAHAEDSPSVDFDTEVMPVLSRFGCNAAACHGGAAGRGGFKLSLFGGDADHDYRALVYELQGRRVNLANPGNSLVIAKPAGLLPHGGEMRFEYDGPEAKLLERWIAEGARRLRSRRLTRMEVTPAKAIVAQLPAPITLQVTASFDDGSTCDVTELALYSSSDEASVAINESGQGSVTQPGRHTLVVKFLDHTQVVEVTAPYPRDGEFSSGPVANWIDEEITQVLAELNLPAAQQCDDTTFLRRVTLDLVGRLPTLDEIETFLADASKTKREAKIDELLASDEFVLFWRYRLAKWLRLRMPGGDRETAEAMFAWLEQRIRDDAPWDATARALVESVGDTREVGPAGFHRLAGDARLEAELVSETLMGVRLRCANCHSHPLDRWTQEDYHGLAAVFAPLERGQVVKLNPLAQVTNPRTGNPAVAQVPGGRQLDGEEDVRAALADWLTSKANPYFRRAIVGRLWQAMMGRGLVEPVDDLRATNPPSHPELLTRLEDHFVDEGYRLRPVLRLIAMSEAYQRVEASSDMPPNRFYTHATRRPLEAEVAADAISQVTQIAEVYPGHASGTQAIGLVDPLVKSSPLDVLGRCDRLSGCTEAGAGGEGGELGLAERLYLLNGDYLNQRLRDERGRLARLVAEQQSPEKIVTEFYLAALSRYPEEQELAWWRERLSSETLAENLEDFVWSLLNSSEFLSNH